MLMMCRASIGEVGLSTSHDRARPLSFPWSGACMLSILRIDCCLTPGFLTWGRARSMVSTHRSALNSPALLSRLQAGSAGPLGPQMQEARLGAGLRML